MSVRLFADVRAILLDRDGVINVESDAFIKSPNEWVPLPGVIEAVAALSTQSVRIAICSNQSGIARNKISGANLSAIHRKMFHTLVSAGGRIDVMRYCPHGPDENCRCRKPRGGMILDLCRTFNLHPKDALVIGDAERDLVAALDAGSRAALVRTGRGLEAERSARRLQVPVFDDLLSIATEFIRQP